MTTRKPESAISAPASPPPSPPSPPAPAPVPGETAPNLEVADRGKIPPKPASENRPAWLPEKFKTPEDLSKSYAELESWKGKKEDELRDALKAEVEAGLFKERPESVEKYQLPEMKDERIDAEAMGKHPLVEWWRQKAFAKGLSQAEFQEGITNYVNALTSNAPDFEAEVKKIGDNAKVRMEEVSLWAQKQWSDPEEFQAVQQVAMTAAGFKALERLMRQTRAGSPPPSDLVPGAPQETEADIKKLMASREYWDPARRDMRVVQKVQDFYARVYGGKK